ncbi:MAG TPA: cadherin domain-containing protein [Gammaproteobacteria bacterium]|nr:cadherin domain-containing protein [Gammaproteobacteria bacterium]
MRKIILLLAVLTGIFLIILKTGIVQAEPVAKLLEPRSLPYALATDTESAVTFKVQLLNQTTDPNPEYIVLKPLDGSGPYKLNDQGKSGDKFARDSIYGGTIAVSAKGRRAGECLQYLASAMVGKTSIESPVYMLCVTSLPIGMAVSNTKPENLINTDKESDPAIANELLVRFSPKATEQLIISAADSVKAMVTGSVLPRRLYQFRFAQTLTLSQLQSYIGVLLKNSAVEHAYLNRAGSLVAIPTDPEFVNQHGLQWINADDSWDLAAHGSGVIVTVLDTGVQTHVDLPLGGTDTANHGTAVAGVIAAITDNATGIAGIAYESTLELFTVSPDSIVTMAEMVSGFQNVAAAGTGQVVTAGFNITLAPPGVDLAGPDQWDLCAAINDVVLNSGTPVAVVVSGAGNDNSDGWHYPSKCNDGSAPANGQLTNKSLLIPVMASVTCNSGCTPDTRQATSNYGTWIDVAAPGQNIRSTNNSGGYSNFTGTSMAMAHVAGTAAQMISCGAAINQVQSRLTSTGPVSIAMPSGGSKPRIDTRAAILAGNTAPTGIGLDAPGSINENTDTSMGYTIATMEAVDGNVCDHFSFNIQGGADAAVFSIGGPDMNQLEITAGVLDFETKASYNVIVRVSDAGGLVFDQPFGITVNDLVENTAPVVNDQSFNIAENLANGSAVGAVAASDAEGNPLSFSITGGNTGGAFAIGAATGALSVANSSALNFETTPSFALTVQVSDGVLTDTATVTVNLSNANEAPVVNDQSFGIAENSANGTPVGIVIATDPDVGTALTYSITGGNTGGAFAIGAGTGALTVANSAVLDFETTPSFALTVQVSDGVLTDTATVAINLTNVVENTAPVVNDQSFGIVENIANGSAVGTVVATDAEGNPLSFSITGGNVGGAFAINAGTGALTVANSAALNFETTPSFALTVQVSDGVLTDTATVTVNLSNANEAPVVNDQSFNINENSANGTAVGTVAASDPDAAAVLAYSITGGNTGGAFAIGAGTGAITVANSAALDFETTPSFALTVQVSDGVLTDTATVTVNLNNLPDTGIPNPIIAWVAPVPYETYNDAFGNPYVRYRFEVTNRSDFPDEMFEASPGLPPCGLNTSSSRTWLYIYNGATNAYIYGFCALGISEMMGQVWFAVPVGGTPPPSIYITLTDRLTSEVYTSNTLTVP